VSADPDGPDACEACGRPAGELEQDPDIFDTWFSSGLWPFSTLGWPEQTADLDRFYPGSVMETGYDIIFFWVARMMMLGIELAGDAPFHTIYLSGLIRDPYGQKMSKTKGNTVDPLGMIDEMGADALRFALVHGTTPGNDQRFGTAKVENARNFANKLWNATRFVLGARPASIPADAPRRDPDPTLLGPAERWVRSRAADTVAAVDRAMGEYAFGEVTRLLYDAIWSEYCDWGLELAKVRLADESLPAAEREATWWSLVEALDTYLRLLHPVMPFLTERLWGAIPHRADDPELLIVARWPAAGVRDAAAETQVGALVELVRAVRNARADARVEPAAWLAVDVFVEPDLVDTLEALRPALERLSRARPLRRQPTRDALHAAATRGLAVIAGSIEAVVGVAVADPPAANADRSRLEKELTDAERLLDAARARVANEAFMARAPEAVVAGARAREAELAEQVERLRDRLRR
jgi:valyl-tRNA synthetase